MFFLSLIYFPKHMQHSIQILDTYCLYMFYVFLLRLSLCYKFYIIVILWVLIKYGRAI